jgi:hypothetical protein
MSTSILAALWVAIAITYAPCVEYLAHRFAMHQPRFGRAWWWREHAIEHHLKGRNDINVDISPVTVSVLASPLLTGCVWLSWPWAVFVAVMVLGYATVWTVLHRAHHDVGCAWVKRLPGYGLWRNHHLQHHTRANKNFGTVFLCTDWLFGTAA